MNKKKDHFPRMGYEAQIGCAQLLLKAATLPRKGELGFFRRCIFDAAVKIGFDGRGAGGLFGYMARLMIDNRHCYEILHYGKSDNPEIRETIALLRQAA